MERIPRVGEVMIKKLLVGGVRKVKQLKYLPNTTRQKLIKGGVSENALESAKARCAEALAGDYPLKVIDHREKRNPYKSRWPDDHESRVHNFLAMKPFVCVTTLVT